MASVAVPDRAPRSAHGLACCSSEWNGSHVNIMRKRNVRQGERKEEFIWTQDWDKWQCPATSGNATGGMWGHTSYCRKCHRRTVGHTCPNCWGLDFLAVTSVCKKLASKDRVRVFLSPAGAGSQ